MRPRSRTLLFAVVLFLLNLWFAMDLLTSEYIDQMGSIEATHITIARWALEHWPNLSWFPLWYNGVPFQNTYNPLHHLIVAAVAGLLGITPALAYHAVTAIFYALGPVTLFWLALRLSGSAVQAFAVGVLYSLVSPSAYLIHAVRWDVGGLWHPRRFQALVQYGEGPHIASLTMLAAALCALSVAFEKRRPVYWFAAAVGMAAVVLTNWIGAFGLAAAAFAWLLSGDRLTDYRRWAAAAATGVFAYALACSWMPPSTIRSVLFNEGNREPLTTAAWAVLILTVAAIAAMLWSFSRFKVPSHIRFAWLLLAPLAAFVLPFHWLRITLMGQGHRLHLEMDMAICLAVVFTAAPLLALRPRLRTAVILALLPVLIVAAVRYRKYASRIDREIDVTKTVEHRHARWFAENMKGRRVMAPGSIGFFMNVWNDVPQFGGGYYQAVLMNPAFEGVYFQVLSGMNAGENGGEIATKWLKAYGVDAVEVSGPESREFYKPFNNPKKFDAILPVLWQDAGNIVYEVPRRSRSLAHAVRAADLPRRSPEHGLDLQPVEKYLEALDDPGLPPANFSWTALNRARIAGSLQPEHLLSVQIAYHHGWHAAVNGESRKTWSDGLGQMVIEPRCAGPCAVELSYDGGSEMAAARAISWTGTLAGLTAIALDLARRRRRVRPVEQTADKA
ncbi:MAG TPA: hypothetical protein VN428_17165 [Bryobacteraceae bacterium]|nr:hypothetical protein [Bryobacteraceae bacterium]